MENLGKIDSSDGLIAVDAKGNITLPFNCDDMYRGSVTQDGDFETAIYRESARPMRRTDAHGPLPRFLRTCTGVSGKTEPQKPSKASPAPR